MRLSLVFMGVSFWWKLVLNKGVFLCYEGNAQKDADNCTYVCSYR